MISRVFDGPGMVFTFVHDPSNIESFFVNIPEWGSLLDYGNIVETWAGLVGFQSGSLTSLRWSDYVNFLGYPGYLHSISFIADLVIYSVSWSTDKGNLNVTFFPDGSEFIISNFAE